MQKSSHITYAIGMEITKLEHLLNIIMKRFFYIIKV